MTDKLLLCIIFLQEKYGFALDKATWRCLFKVSMSVLLKGIKMQLLRLDK